MPETTPTIEPSEPPESEQLTLAHERTLLAAERTFLSWLRTGLTSIGIGIAIARFIIFKNISNQQLGHFVGQVLIMWGLCIFIFALIHYRRSCIRIKHSVPTKDSFSSLIIITGVLVMLSFFLLLIIVE